MTNDRRTVTNPRPDSAITTFISLDEPNGTLTPALMARLGAAVRESEERSGCHVLILTGAGGQVFCSGMDVEAVGADRAGLAEQAGQMYELLLGLRDSRLLTVCAVDGWVSGGGIGLLAASDLVYATPRSRFSLPEILWDLVPWTVLPFLRIRLSRTAASRMALTGIPIGAESAASAGLVDEVTADLEGTVSTLSRRMAQISPEALEENKAYLARLDGPLFPKREVVSAISTPSTGRSSPRNGMARR